MTPEELIARAMVYADEAVPELVDGCEGDPMYGHSDLRYRHRLGYLAGAKELAKLALKEATESGSLQCVIEYLEKVAP